MDTAAGVSVLDALAGHERVEDLLASQPASAGLRTPRSVAYLRWRYGLSALHYRAVLRTQDAADGFAVLRCRRRGRSSEAAIVEVLVPHDDEALRRDLATRAVADTEADYGIALGPRRPRSASWLPLPRAGPRLTCRVLEGATLAQPSSLASWDLTLGDVELL